LVGTEKGKQIRDSVMYLGRENEKGPKKPGRKRGLTENSTPLCKGTFGNLWGGRKRAGGGVDNHNWKTKECGVPRRITECGGFGRKKGGKR